MCNGLLIFECVLVKNHKTRVYCWTTFSKINGSLLQEPCKKHSRYNFFAELDLNYNHVMDGWAAFDSILDWHNIKIVSLLGGTMKQRTRMRTLNFWRVLTIWKSFRTTAATSSAWLPIMTELSAATDPGSGCITLMGSSVLGKIHSSVHPIMAHSHDGSRIWRQLALILGCTGLIRHFAWS